MAIRQVGPFKSSGSGDASPRVECPAVPRVLPSVQRAVAAERDGVEELGSRIVGLAGRLAAATCRWLLLVADFDARDGCGRYGLASTVRWLTHYCGLSKRTAVEHVRVARALRAAPALAETFGTGRVSYSHVRAISRLVEIASPKLIEELLELAQHSSIAQLEDVVRGLRTAGDPSAPSAPGDSGDPGGVEPERVSQRWGSDSRWHASVQLDAEHGAAVQAMLKAIAQAENISTAQALVRMADLARHALTGIPAAPTEAAVLKSPDTSVVVHLDARQVPAGEGGARSRERSGSERGVWRRPFARLADGPGLSRAVAERLCCSGRIRTVVEGADGHVLDVGRERRLVTTRQLIALLQRDVGCAHPGCGSTAGLQAHHVQHWLYNGKTNMANLILLCAAHHMAIHHGEFSIEALGRERFRFRRADGAEYPTHVDPTTCTDASDGPVERDHADVAATAATTRWDGTRLDRAYATSGLARGLDLAAAG
jgi:hypothetical protein